jgi:DNA-binding transcriptional LysR family regulator
MDGIENPEDLRHRRGYRSLAAAASRLNIVASVVTKRIDQLESRVPHDCSNAAPSACTLTEFGARYLPRARRLIHDYEEVFAAMSHSPRQVEGHIRIRVPTPMAIGFMAEALAKFQRQYRA